MYVSAYDEQICGIVLTKYSAVVKTDVFTTYLQYRAQCDKH